MKIGLFIPCYVDALYPEVGVATYKLLTSLGLDVTYPLKQTCCGQPMANAGFEKMATDIVRHFDDIFREFDYVVAPSASCAAFVKLYHPRLAKGNHECLTSKKIMDVVEFLHDVVKPTSLKAHFPPTSLACIIRVTAYASCICRRLQKDRSLCSTRSSTSSNSWTASPSGSRREKTSVADSAECSP